MKCLTTFWAQSCRACHGSSNDGGFFMVAFVTRVDEDITLTAANELADDVAACVDNELTDDDTGRIDEDELSDENKV